MNSVVILLLATAFTAFAYTDGTKKLLFVQSMWRHGDRSPTETFKSDYFQEDAWDFGGTGWGQLSPTGMRQHLTLGKLIRTRYVDNWKFLPERYNSKQIYIRSTDVNRTLISAYSNMLGMYGQNNGINKNGTDYPDVEGWPVGFVPVPIHTVDDTIDHLGNMDSHCGLKTKTWALTKQSQAIQNWTNSDEVSSLLKQLTDNCKQTIDIDNLWVVQQSLFIEQIYKNETLRKQNSWFTDALYNQIDSKNDQIDLFNDGDFDTQQIVQGIDVGLLTKKTRGGSLVNDVLDHIHQKLSCQNDQTRGCTWINNLLYYAYSIHDTTIYAYFSALGIEKSVIKPEGGLPMYSACVLIELYQDTQNNQTYFKMLYHKNDGVGFTDITSLLDGCPAKNDYCPTSVYEKLAAIVKPDKPMAEWCNDDLPIPTGASSSISVVIGIFVALFSMLRV